MSNEAFTTITAEIAAEVPALKDRVGESIEAGELAQLRADKGDKGEAKKEDGEGGDQ